MLEREGQESVHERGKEARKLATFATWTGEHPLLWYRQVVILLTRRADWDLGVCLPQECRWKNIYRPKYFNYWCDVRASFVGKGVKGLAGALKEVGVRFEVCGWCCGCSDGEQGRQHSGIADATNTAVLVK